MISWKEDWNTGHFFHATLQREPHFHTGESLYLSPYDLSKKILPVYNRHFGQDSGETATFGMK